MSLGEELTITYMNMTQVSYVGTHPQPHCWHLVATMTYLSIEQSSFTPDSQRQLTLWVWNYKSNRSQFWVWPDFKSATNMMQCLY